MWSSAVGEGVTEVAPGDRVILNWRAVCGQCRACAKGQPQYCFNTANATQKMTLEDGTELSPALGIGAFAEKTLVAAGQCTKVDEDADPAAVGLLGCGVMAGIGAAINTGEVKRGESVAVIGCGGVGIAAIAGAKLAGATTIIAVDIDENKIEMAKSLGATHGVNSRTSDPVEAIRALTGGNGADVVIEAVGRPETYKQAFYARDLAGRVVLVGVPTPEMKLELPLLDVFGRGGSLKSSWYGDCLPSRDFPMLVSHYKQGNLDLDAFVSERITIDQVEEAFDKMHEGKVLRSVVEIQPGSGRPHERHHRKPRHLGHVLARRRHLGRGQQRLDRGQRRRMRHHRLPARRRRDHQPGPRPEGPGHPAHPRAQRPHRRRPRGRRRRRRPDPPEPGGPGPLGTGLPRHHTGRRPSPTGTSSRWAGPPCRRSTPPATHPGSTCFHLESEGTVFTGDTLFNGGPGATGRSYSDYPTILTSIRERLLTLPPDTVVRTGHGDNTTIAAERKHSPRFRSRTGFRSSRTQEGAPGKPGAPSLAI